MEQCAFQFDARVHCRKGKQCHNITIANKNNLCSKISSIFSFYAVPTSGKLKGTLVQ